MRGVHGTSRLGASCRRLGRGQVFPTAGHGTLTSLVTFAAAVVVAAVLPLTAGTIAAGAATSSTAWTQIAAGAVHTCGVSTGHTLWCWGGNGNGELGIGSTALSEDLPQPVTTPAATGWDTVTAGGKGAGGWTCAIRTGHTLWCWGEGGVLGIGNDFDQNLPQQVTTPSATGWATVSAGAFHTCATRTDGTLWCWGDNGAGRLGIGNTVAQELPQQVTTPAATGWATVTAGGAHTCATRTDTTLWCWGSNLTGQLGIGSSTVTSEHLPQQVTTPSATGWAAVTAGDSHTCATQTDQTLWCWGYNNSGQVGIGSTAPNANLPQQVTTPAATGWATISAGGFHSCATRTDGTLWCWGANYDGQLGIGSSASKHLPQQVAKSATTPWATVSAGGLHSCATRTNRTLWCWGYNNSGELGIGNTTIQYRPQRVTA
jgi:alpha-tubulin suppressor-like RCC1 family protein